jgi:hypothetical protein
MTRLKTFIAAALISTISATSAIAQQTDAAQYPNRDMLNGGEQTPAARMGLGIAGGGPIGNATNNANANANAHAQMRSAKPSSGAQRHALWPRHEHVPRT